MATGRGQYKKLFLIKKPPIFRHALLKNGRFFYRFSCIFLKFSEFLGAKYFYYQMQNLLHLKYNAVF